jgi:catechol 2,3-dioxygenase-like lactoylglutathione lyase family enzyme
MLGESKAFSGFAVDDVDKAKEFYGEKLGLEVKVVDEENGLGEIHSGAPQPTLFYAKPDLKPANNTILNFPVDDIDETVDGLAERGVEFEKYDDENLPQDEKGVMRGLEQNQGPNIAWFKDPAGNILSVLQEK